MSSTAPDSSNAAADESSRPADRDAASGGVAEVARFPKKMLFLTGLYILVVVLAFMFPSDVEDHLGIGLDVVMVVTIFSSAAMILLWVGWFLLLSRWRWWTRILASVLMVCFPFVLQKILGPVLGGDVTIQRFEPIWASRPETPSSDEIVPATTVDLVTETPLDFPRFLGPEQDSIVRTGVQIDVERFTDAKVLWKQPIGNGWSGFVARNGYAVTMEQREEQECVTCYDVQTGTLQWISKHTARHRDAMNLGRTGPRATPTIHDGRVYAVGAVGSLVCLNGGDGTELWKVDLNEVLGLQLASKPDADGLLTRYEGNSRLAWGRSGAPLIVDDLVVVPGGGPREGPFFTLLAFDRLTGELLWKGGDQMIAYGSPVLATVAGVNQILMVAESMAMGFDPKSGQKLWDFPRPGDSEQAANTSQLAVVSPDRVLTSKGYTDGGGRVIELTNTDGRIVAKSIWHNPRALKTKLMSPVLYDGYAYSISNGFLECARLSDGERIWKHRGRFGHGQLLLVGDQILLHSEMGELFLIRATPEGVQESGMVPTISGVCWNTLCLYGNRLLVRSEIEAACVELPTK